MPNPRLAGRYAKSLIGLSTERNQLETVITDMKFLQAAIKSSPEFSAFLRSPIIKADKKQAIIQAITDKRISELTSAFIKLLVNKGRESDLPEIVEAFIAQYNVIKHIHKVKFTTAVPVSEEIVSGMIAKVKQEAGLQNVEMETSVDPEIIGGFILEFNNNLVDASILRDLNDVKKQFKKNIYIQQIR